MSLPKYTLLTVTVLAMVAINSVKAQTPCFGIPSGSRHHQVHRHDRGNVLHGRNNYLFGYHGYRSVGYGDAAHGLADLVRAGAEANLLNAQASSQSEVTRAQKLENNVLALQTRLERKHINKESRFGHLHARAADLAQLSLARANAPRVSIEQKRLSPHEVEPHSGKLAWPLLLAMSHFELARHPIDEVFAMRAEAGSLHPDDYLPLLDLIDQLMSDLHMNATIFPKRDLADAEDFLRRMKFEVRLPAGMQPSDVQLVSRADES